jgi:hypothetical protein
MVRMRWIRCVYLREATRRLNGESEQEQGALVAGAVWRLGANNCRSAFVAARWRPRRQDSHV